MFMLIVSQLVFDKQYISWRIDENDDIHSPPRQIFKDSSILLSGAISTEHSSSELRVIGTNAHRFDSYFLHLTMHTYNLTLLYVVQLTLSSDELCSFDYPLTQPKLEDSVG